MHSFFAQVALNQADKLVERLSNFTGLMSFSFVDKV